MAGKKKTQSVEPVRTPTDIDVAWIAGLYEGEGTCYGHKNSGRISVGIYQKDPEILYWCMEMFGGWISLMRPGQEHECHVWNLGGDNARLFLQAIYPFMSARRKVQIDRTSFLRFTGCIKNTRPEMSEQRTEARSVMTASQKKQDSKQQWVDRNKVMFNAYMREVNRRNYAKRRDAAKAESNLEVIA